MSKRTLSSSSIVKEEEGGEECTKKPRLLSSSSAEEGATDLSKLSGMVSAGPSSSSEGAIRHASVILQGFLHFIEGLTETPPIEEEEDIVETINAFFWGEMSSDNDHRLYEECQKMWDLMHNALKNEIKWESKYGCNGGVYQMLLESAIERDDVRAFKYMRSSCRDEHYRKLAGKFVPCRYEDTYQLMRACCRCGSLKVLKEMKEMESLRSFMGCWEVKQAVRENHQELFDWLMDETLVRNDSGEYSDSVEEMACLGRIEMYQRMMRKQLLPSSWDTETGEVLARQKVCCDWKPKVDNVGVHLRLAALGGHWNLFDWILEESKREGWGLKVITFLIEHCSPPCCARDGT